MIDLIAKENEESQVALDTSEHICFCLAGYVSGITLEMGRGGKEECKPW